MAPADLDGFDRFMVRSAAICELGFEQLGHVPFMSLGDLVRHAPALLRLGQISVLIVGRPGNYSPEARVAPPAYRVQAAAANSSVNTWRSSEGKTGL